MELPPQLVPFLESGVSMSLGTCDARRQPECARGVGARAAEGVLTVFVPVASAGRTVANLRENGRLAVTFSRPIDPRTVQIKGRATAIRAASEEERSVTSRYRWAFAESLEAVGLPHGVGTRLGPWPAWAITVEIEDIFDQTPGPGAGAPLKVG